ncbi:MAG: polysaccharide deacetylase family protein [Luteolibacter sp.]
MNDPQHPLDAQEPSLISKLSRRTFLMLSAAFSSCSVAAPLSNATGSSGVKTPSNTGYRTPPVKTPVPRNPSNQFSSDTSHTSGLTFTRVQVSGKYIAMTFDDGPHPQNTPRLLNMLRERNIKATFFVIGQSANLYPGVLRQTLAEGHEIANHSHTHRVLSKLSDDELIRDLTNCQNAVIQATGFTPRVMRPPYGALTQRQRELVHQKFGFKIILWSVDPLDWKRPGSAVVTQRILDATTPGGIILAHDIHAQTIDAMPATLDTLLSRGYQFVTVSQLLAMQQAPAAAPASAAAPQ